MQKNLFALRLLLMIPVSTEAQQGKAPFDILVRSSSEGSRAEIGCGDSAVLEGVARNRSDRTITGMRISAAASERWAIRIDPEIIIKIDPGEPISFSIEIVPPRTLLLERRRSTFTARAGTSVDTCQFMAVANSRKVWISGAVVLVVLMVIAFGLIYWRLDRS